MSKLLVFFSISFFLLFFVSSAFAENITLQQQATKCLFGSSKLIAELNNSNFSTERTISIYDEAVTINEAQILLESRQKGKGSFDLVIKKCDEIESLSEQAYQSRDYLNSLEKFYNEEISEGIDTTSIDGIIAEIKLEIKNERYERVNDLIDGAYEEISRLRQENTQLKLFYQATTKGFFSFVLKYKWTLGGIVLFLVVFILFYRVTIYKAILIRKRNKLQLRKSSIEDLLKKTQKDYFQHGKISESDYNIRVKNFGELVRDIDRQIPLLNEQLAKLSKQTKPLKKEKIKKGKKKR